MSDQVPSTGSDNTAAGIRAAGAAKSNHRKRADPSRTPPFTHTRASGYWAAVVVGLLVLVVLIIFILANGQRAEVSFFGAHTHLPEGVALLLAAVIGGLFVVLAGTARILQLRSRAQGRPLRAARRRRSRS
jgi:uncharacterized integral membrane protein